MSNFYFLPIVFMELLIPQLQDKTFNNIKKVFKFIRKCINSAKTDKLNLLESTALTGLFLLCDDENILSIAVVQNAKLDRIYTYPNYRNKGYASNLLHKIVEFGLKNNIMFFSPVDLSVKKLFEKENWVAISNKQNHDKSIDYCHKIFQKKLRECNNVIEVKINSKTILDLHEMMLPFNYL